MEAFLKQIKFIEQTTRSLVNGFVYESQSLLPKDNHYFIIPSLVIYTILYYFYDPERFDQCDQGIKLNDERTIATQTLPMGEYKTVYGTKLIPPNIKGIYEWKFKAFNVPRSDYHLIGIHSFTNYKKLIHDDCSEGHNHKTEKGSSSHFWAATDGGYKYSVKGYEPFLECKWKHGDTITMILNTAQSTLSFGRNNKDSIIAFKDIALNEETYMIIIVGDREIAIELLSFLYQNTSS